MIQATQEKIDEFFNEREYQVNEPIAKVVVLGNPLSDNHLYGHYAIGKRVIRFMKKEGKDYKKLCAVSAGPEAKPVDYELVADVVLYFNDHRRRDVQGALKALFDGFNEILYDDDSQIIKFTAEKRFDKNLPRAEIRLWKSLEIYHKVKSDRCSYLTEDYWETGNEVFYPSSKVEELQNRLDCIAKENAENWWHKDMLQRQKVNHLKEISDFKSQLEEYKKKSVLKEEIEKIVEDNQDKYNDAVQKCDSWEMSRRKQVLIEFGKLALSKQEK